VDLLKPILDEMVRTGQQHGARRPWLGVNSLEEDGRVKVMHVNEDSPAFKAGIEAGDIILSINGESVESLEKFYGKLRNEKPPGTIVNLTVLHGPNVKQVAVTSIDRADFMRKKPGV
jgi:S1-C subfamily serine protease